LTEEAPGLSIRWVAFSLVGHQIRQEFGRPRSEQKPRRIVVSQAELSRMQATGVLWQQRPSRGSCFEALADHHQQNPGGCTKPTSSLRELFGIRFAIAVF